MFLGNKRRLFYGISVKTLFEAFLSVELQYKKCFPLQIRTSGYYNLPNYVKWLLKALTLYIVMFRIIVSLAPFLFSVTAFAGCGLNLLGNHYKNESQWQRSFYSCWILLWPQRLLFFCGWAHFSIMRCHLKV